MAFVMKTVNRALLLMLLCKLVLGKNFFMSSFCGRTLDMHQRRLNDLVLNLTDHPSYWGDVSCQVDIVTSPRHQLSFKILKMDIRDCNDKLFLYGDSTNSSDAIYAHVCSTYPDVYVTPGSKGIVTFTSNEIVHRGGFTILITSFNTAVKGRCKRGYFKCGNNRCINTALISNCRNNCGDNSDERNNKEICGKKEKKNYSWVAGPVVAFLFISWYIYCMREKIKAKLCGRCKSKVKAPSKPKTETPAKPKTETPAKPKIETPAKPKAETPSVKKEDNEDKSGNKEASPSAEATDTQPDTYKTTNVEVQTTVQVHASTVTETAPLISRIVDDGGDKAPRTSDQLVIQIEKTSEATPPANAASSGAFTSTSGSETSTVQASLTEKSELSEVSNPVTFSAGSQVVPIYIQVHPLALPPVQSTEGYIAPTGPPPPYVPWQASQLPRYPYNVVADSAAVRYQPEQPPSFPHLEPLVPMTTSGNSDTGTSPGSHQSGHIFQLPLLQPIISNRETYNRDSLIGQQDRTTSHLQLVEPIITRTAFNNTNQNSSSV